MAKTAASVCNVALVRVGQRQLIDDLESDDTEQANLCDAVFEHVRDAVLEQIDWPFARRRAVLGPLSFTVTGYAGAYALPADCGTPRRIDSGVRPDIDPVVYRLETDARVGGLILLTDWSAPELCYTSNDSTVLAPANWSAGFADAVAWGLAVELTLSLPIKPQLAARAVQMFNAVVEKAKAGVFNSEREDFQPDAEGITART